MRLFAVRVCDSYEPVGLFWCETLTGLIEIHKANPHLLKRSSDPK